MKRLFLLFADRHRHAWPRHRATVNLGVGKRRLVRKGRLDPVHLIALPRDLEARDLEAR